ncbi:MAG: Mrp/NBP35 family ATP-binding protein [Clostridiales bacterium]|nr:Mrp/NBP35 family ATP-binding protein [Clostridiales bacterium]
MIYDDSQEKVNEESGCTHDCSSCSANCSSREKESLIEKPHELSKIKKVIGIVSGKGGVGKSIVTSMLSVIMSRRGYNTAILDADITGPSIPKAFGVKGEVTGDGAGGIFPLASKTGIKMMSVNLLLSDETTPVVWRGPVIAGTVKQFWTDVIWDDVDFMFVDMPPGTGDVPLTVFQSIPLDGIIIVASPQELVSMIVAKAANMAQMMNIPVVGLVENMAYFKCPDCGKEYKLFGDSHISEVADKFGYDVLAHIPVDPRLAALCDKGILELMENDYLDSAADKLEKLL